MALKFHVAPQNQGQAVEVAYASYYDGEAKVVRKITDRSLREGHPERVTYAETRMLADDEGDYWQSVPQNKRWRKLAACPRDPQD